MSAPCAANNGDQFNSYLLLMRVLLVLGGWRLSRILRLIMPTKQIKTSRVIFASLSTMPVIPLLGHGLSVLKHLNADPRGGHDKGLRLRDRFTVWGEMTGRLRSWQCCRYCSTVVRSYVQPSPARTTGSLSRLRDMGHLRSSGASLSRYSSKPSVSWSNARPAAKASVATRTAWKACGQGGRSVDQ